MCLIFFVGGRSIPELIPLSYTCYFPLMGLLYMETDFLFSDHSSFFFLD